MDKILETVCINDYEALLDKASGYAKDYVKESDTRRVFPSEEAVKGLDVFKEKFPEGPSDPSAVIDMLQKYGAPGTSAATAGKYFGFVTGSILPVANAAGWMSDTWNQNAAYYVMSPTASVLEDQCEKWLTDLFMLEEGTALGLVSGSANALICGLAAARFGICRRNGYDLAKKGFKNAPKIRVVLGEDAHTSVFAAISLLGFGEEEVEKVPVDECGRMRPECVPELDSNTIFILQAGHVTGGAFDDINTLCDMGNKAGAWVHVDGAFGLWARTTAKQRHLVNGLEKADSVSADAHKTLNVGYDCGFVLCKHREALAGAFELSGSYLEYSENRDGSVYCSDMSRRSRGIALWATLKSLGRSGVEELVDTLCDNAAYFAEGLEKAGYTIINRVFINQFMFKAASDEKTAAILKKAQESGLLWNGGCTWKGEKAIRISVCSYRTTRADIDACVEVYRKLLEEA